MPTYEVQRKYIGWETTLVDADNPDEAIDKAEEQDSWLEATDSYLTTEDYWVSNEDTKQSSLRLERTGWEEEID